MTTQEWCVKYDIVAPLKEKLFSPLSIINAQRNNLTFLRFFYSHLKLNNSCNLSDFLSFSPFPGDFRDTDIVLGT